jgi:glutamyl-Q tRNA(Asp) synthetase
VLAQVLAVLGHPLPFDLTGAEPAELLAWASAHWHIENVPRQAAIANHTP